MFTGVKLLPVVELGVSQIYLNETKLANVRKWLNPANLSILEPLSVHDFGNGRLTLTDGHSRAFSAYTMGIQYVPCVYDKDDIVTSELGHVLYKNDISWCERFGIHSVLDLEDRIVPDDVYQKYWVERCDKAYNLLTQTTETQRQQIQNMHPGLYLYGANEDVSVYYFENDDGVLLSFSMKKD